MEIKFEDNLNKCIENLKNEEYSAATGDLYPVSKQTPRLAYASNGVVCKFASQMVSVLDILGEKLGDRTKTFIDMEKARYFLMDIYRVLRNSCAANSLVQEEYGLQGETVLTSTRTILLAVRKHFRGEAMVQCLAVGIQFLSNLATNSQRNQDLVWDYFSMHLRGWLDMTKGEQEMDQERSIKILNYTCALVEVCLPRQWERKSNFLDEQDVHNTIVGVIQACCSFNLDFGKKVMAKVVQIPGMIKTLMVDLTYPERGCVLCNMQDVISEWRRSEEGPVPNIQSNLQFLCEFLFAKRPYFGADLLYMPQADNDFELHQQVRMLEVLSEASSCKCYQTMLNNVSVVQEQGTQTLVMYALELLYEIHRKGREGRNMLSMTSDRREVNEGHPAYLLRRDLVRLIGNLSYQTKAVQDQVREAYGKIGIPLLFDHTMIDERNPFIAEWSKLALTNLVRDNEDNAKFIKSLKLQGHVDPTGILRDCGLTLEAQGDKVIVKSEGSLLSPNKLTEKAPNRN